MVHVYSRSPLYAALLARVRSEDRRLSLIEYETQAIWVPVTWYREVADNRLKAAVDAKILELGILRAMETQKRISEAGKAI